MKPCLLISEIPLKSGEDQNAPCGRRISRAAWVGQCWEQGEDGQPHLVACPECVAYAERTRPTGKYLYLAVDGERVRQMEEA